jgi:hypothetical protein
MRLRFVPVGPAGGFIMAGVFSGRDKKGAVALDDK